MREKIEREGVGKNSSHAGGGVRLSEYDSGRGDSFVRKLNREATSFFFTQFSEDTLVVDLWRVFAKFGRVGEVYVPKKLDKWGRRFGFVKYLEVKNVEELSLKLEDVWVGSNKLRINLSFFGRDGKQTSTKNPKTGEEGKRKPVEGGKKGVFKEAEVCPEKSFRAAVEGAKATKAPQAKGKEVTVQAMEVVQHTAHLPFEPNAELMSVFKGSFVGRLIPGSLLKNIQLNLCVEGLRGIRVASLGDGRVVVFSETGEDVGLAIDRKTWWNGLLHDFHPWYPAVVSTKREVWVKIFGVPLQLWDEFFFSSITEKWGVLLGLDDDTKGHVRFDRARVKLLSPVFGSIDFTQCITVQDLNFSVRVMEESSGPLEFVHSHKEEDQLQWSAVASSCDSGEHGPAAAEVVGVVFEESDSDSSVKGHHRDAAEVQGGHNLLVNKKNFEVVPQDPLDKTVEVMPFSSNGVTEIGGEGIKQVGASDEVQVVRGLSTSNSENQVYLEKGGSVEPVDVGAKEFEKDDEAIGPSLSCPDPSPVIGELIVDLSEPVWVEPLLEEEAGQNGGLEKMGLGPAGFVLEKLDGLLQETRGNGVGENKPLSHGELSDLSTSTSSHSTSVSSIHKKGNRNKKQLPPRPQSHLSGGPKCIRFAEAVINAGATSKRRFAPTEKGVAERSLEVEPVEVTGRIEGEGVFVEPGLSGMKVVMGEEDLEDVEGYVRNREDPIAKVSEAELILQIQSDLGLNFVEGVNATVENLKKLEDRDRVDLQNYLESNGSQ
jgi:hypothetical protein